MSLSQLLGNARSQAENLVPAALPDGFPAHVLFFSVSTGRRRCHMEIARGKTFDAAWLTGAKALQKWRKTQSREVCWLRIDAVAQVEALRWDLLQRKLAHTKRNYFRFGLSFDPRFDAAMLEQEIMANAVLYDGSIATATANAVNLANYAQRRFGYPLHWPEQPEQILWRFTTRALFCDSKQCWRIEHQGRASGYRKLDNWTREIPSAAGSATAYLASQVKASGEYYYGWFPCFDRPVAAYNALRHASSTYALLEGWELTKGKDHKAAIDRALRYLTQQLIHRVTLPDGQEAAFLVDTDNEIKLGGNAVAILALAKYCELTGEQDFIPLMRQLATGILFMQCPASGSFRHVLNYPDLSVKAEHRIIYYDGEAAFALMRLYGLTQEAPWLDAVEKAFDYFIAEKHWQAHDHWLSYCVNELTRWCPAARYYQFGLDNVREHLDFVLQRLTTYPTLLELMMATRQMLTRLEQDADHAHLLTDFDRKKFDRALHHRARYLFNGYFWPELAMFFANPARIVGSFFIRHHSCRVRIDDVEHYLSGLIAYLKMVRGGSLDTGEERLIFLAGNLRDIGNGIEVATLRRATLFYEKVGISAEILIADWNSRLYEITENFKQQGKLPLEVAVSGVYERLPELYRQKLILPLAAADANWLLTEQSSMGPVRRLRYRNGEEQICAEDYVDDKNRVLMRRLYDTGDDVSQPERFELHWLKEGARYYSKERMVARLAEAGLTPHHRWHFLVDKNKVWREFILSRPQQRINATVSAMIHSTHRLPSGRLKRIYAHLLEQPDHLDALIVLTQQQQQDLLQEGFPAARLYAIPHPLAQVIPAGEHKKEPGKNVIVMARYAPEKRHSLLIRVFARVLQRVPDAHLYTWGTGSLRQTLVQQVEQAGLQQSVHIHGFTRDIRAVHEQACCAVLCSDQEGMSLFALEAMNYGTPLISFDIPYGPRDLLSSFDAGKLVPDGDEEGLADALVELLQDEKKQKKQQMQALRSAARYHPDKVAEKWAQWWRRMQATGSVT